jgi:hypothetical protein
MNMNTMILVTRAYSLWLAFVLVLATTMEATAAIAPATV